MLRTGATVAVLLLTLTTAACGREGDGSASSGEPARTAATIEDSWSQLYEEINTELRANEDFIPAGKEKCLDGDHGARLTVAHRETTDMGLTDTVFVYGFGRTCGIDQAKVVLKWSASLSPEVTRGERLLRQIPAAYAQILEDRTLLNSGDLDQIVAAAESSKAATGRYPASMEDGALGDLDRWPSESIVDYTPTPDRAAFRLCVQSVRSGPWETYDSARNGLVAIGDAGACSFKPAPAGSLREVRRDLRALVALKEGPRGFGCKRLPSDADLRADGVLSANNQVAGCKKISHQEDAVTTENLCVQHGTDGAWATYDVSRGTFYGKGGGCDLQPEVVQRGPYLS